MPDPTKKAARVRGTIPVVCSMCGWRSNRARVQTRSVAIPLRDAFYGSCPHCGGDVFGLDEWQRLSDSQRDALRREQST